MTEQLRPHGKEKCQTIDFPRDAAVRSMLQSDAFQDGAFELWMSRYITRAADFE
jgi:hypothetical protein